MRLIRLILATSFAIIAAGCATPPAPLNFSVPDVGVSNKKIDAEVKAITVTLARPDEKKGDMPLGIEGVTGFWKEALQESLDRMAIFKDDAKTKVSIQVKILAFDIPNFGLEMTSKAIARYEIIDRATGSIIYTQEIASTGVVPVSHAFIGAIRARESINRAAQNNIKQFLQAVETIDIEKPMFPNQKQ